MSDTRHDEPPTELPAATLTRREVVTMGAIAAAAGITGVIPVARYLRPGGASDTTGVAELRVEELGMWDAVPLIVAQRPAVVVRTPAEVFAVGSRCPHLACIVKWQKSRRMFFCPCHGARFAPDGSLLGGPSPGPLPSLKVSEAAGRIRVELV